eukprot:5636630-Lingulodinium_polyedra.AAC.1
MAARPWPSCRTTCTPATAATWRRRTPPSPTASSSTPRTCRTGRRKTCGRTSRPYMHAGLGCARSAATSTSPIAPY